MTEEEVCPHCAKEGDKSPKQVKVKKEEGKTVKEFSCGHKIEIVSATLAMKYRTETDQIKRFLRTEKS